jgi:outer membrane protein
MKQLLENTRKTLVIVSTLFVSTLISTPSASAQAPASKPAAASKLSLTPSRAVATALAHNLSLAVAKKNPALFAGPELSANGPFDLELFATVDLGRSPGSISAQRAGLAPVSSTSLSASVGVRKRFSTGTSVEVGVATNGLFGAGNIDPAYQSRAELTLKQSLLEGISRKANEVAIDNARLSRTAAQYELQRRAELVARDTLLAYFDLHAALARDRIQEQAIASATETLQNTKALIAAGKVGKAELISAQYALEVQKRAKLQSEQAVGDARDKLGQLMGIVTSQASATPALETSAVGDLAARTKALDARALTNLQKSALQTRGDLLAARENIERSKNTLSAAKHTLLPRLDVQASVFAAGLSGTSSDPTANNGIDAGYGTSFKMDRAGWSVGLMFEIPLGNRAAKGAVKTAEVNVQRANSELSLLEQTISRELSVAWRALATAKAELTSSQLATEIAKSKLDAERERFKNGKTTAHILSTVEADLYKEQQAVAVARAKLARALTNLHAASGHLLDRVKSI